MYVIDRSRLWATQAQVKKILHFFYKVVDAKQIWASGRRLHFKIWKRRRISQNCLIFRFINVSVVVIEHPAIVAYCITLSNFNIEFSFYLPFAIIPNPTYLNQCFKYNLVYARELEGGIFERERENCVSLKIISNPDTFIELTDI